jgi:chemotaxis signal transduction protein
LQQLLVTRVGKRYAGWITADLAEVVSAPKIFPLPAPFPCLAGTAFLRGKLITVIDTFSLMEERRDPQPCELLIQLAPPLSHLAVTIPSIEAVIHYGELNLREEEAGGIWAGLYPWEDVWVNVVKPSAVAAELGRVMAASVRYQAAGREHAL